MKHIKPVNQLADSIVNQSVTVQQDTVNQQHNQPQAAWEINKVLRQLMACFPAWRTAIKSKEELAAYKKELLAALIENNVTSLEQIALGMKKARSSNSDFIPSAGKFISWCLGTDEKGDPEQDMISNQQALQAKAPPLMLRKKPTDEDINKGNDALTNLKGMMK